MDTNDHKLLRKLLDDLGWDCLYDDSILSLQLDSGMVAEVRFVDPATLPELVNANPDIACCAREIGDVVCASDCEGCVPCPHDDGRCCEVCAHYNGGKLTEVCYHCSMLSQWCASELTEDEIEALTDRSVFPTPCETCTYSYYADSESELCGACGECGKGDPMWEPKG